MRTVVVGASTGLGRCIGIGLAQRGARVALLARSLDKLESAAQEAGDGAVAIACDVTDEPACRAAIAKAAADLGGIDAFVYTPAIGPLARLAETDADTWQRTFATNVTGAAIATSAAIPALTESSGTALFLSSVSASLTPPWPGLAAYAVSKAALDKLVEACRPRGIAVMTIPTPAMDAALVRELYGRGATVSWYGGDLNHIAHRFRRLREELT